MRLRSMALAALFLALLLLASLVRANDAGNESPFAVGMTARATGLGGAYISLATDATALYYNPSGLIWSDYQQALFSHSLLVENSTVSYGAWIYPITTRHGLGLGFMRVGTGDIQRTSGFRPSGVFDYSYSQLALSYGFRPLSQLSLGGSLKLVRQSLDNLSDNSFGVDAGLMFRPVDHLSLGVVARDLFGPELDLQSASEATPSTVAAGLSLREIKVSRSLSVTAALDLEKIENRDVLWHAGGELLVDGLYAIRAGYNRDNLAFGLGLKYQRFQLDYAYQLVDYLDDTHYFSLSFMFGGSVSERMARKRVLSQSIPKKQSERERLVSMLRDKAEHFFHQFAFDSALVYYKRALEIEPDNQEFLANVAAIQRTMKVERQRTAQLQEAERELRKTLSTYYQQAQQFFIRKHFAAAKDLLSLIFDIRPDDPEALKLENEIDEAVRKEIAYNLDIAKNALNSGRIAEAIEAYNRILELDPENVEVQSAKRKALASLDLAQQIRVGIELFNKGRLRDAERRFRAVLEASPDEPLAKEYLDKVREAQERVTSLEDLQKDKKVWQLYVDGLRAMRNRQYRKAIDLWERVLKVYPNSPDTRNNIEQARLRLQSEADSQK